MKTSKQIRNDPAEPAEPSFLAGPAGPAGVVDCLPAAIWEVEAETLSLTYLNRRAAELLRCDPARLPVRGRDWAGRAFGDDGARVVEVLRAVMDDGAPRRIEHGCSPAVEEAGRPARWFETSVQVSRRAGVHVAALVGMTTDVSERRQAEALARLALEQGTIEQRRAAERLGAQQMAARVLAESSSLSEAMSQILKNVCRALDWQFGAYWAADRHGTLLRCEQIWAVDELAGSEFVEMARSFTMRAGQGMPGRALARRAPVWIPDVGAEPEMPRAAPARRADLHAGVAFPVCHGPDVLGVMEFFTRDLRPPDDDLLQMMATIGNQVCQFMKRASAQQAVLDSEAHKAAIIASALDCIVSMDHQGLIREFNPAAEQTFGWRAAEVVGQPVCDRLVPHRERDRFRHCLARFLNAGDRSFLGRRLEVSALRSDGSELPIEVAVTVTAADPPVFTAFLRDITERVRSFDGLQRSRDELSTILQGISEGVTVRDAAGRLVFANDAAAVACGPGGVELSGEMLDPSVSVDDTLGRFEVFDQDGRPLAPLDLPGRRALRGTPHEALLRFRDASSDAEDRWAVVKSIPTFGPGGEVRFAITTLREVTKKRRAEDWQRFLGEATAIFSSSFDFEKNLETMAAAAARSIADWCAVDLKGPGGSVRRLALAHANPALAEHARLLASAPAPAEGPLRGARVRIFPRITAAMLAAAEREPERLAELRALDVRSVMQVPLVVRDEIVGLVTLATAGPHARRYSTGDRDVAGELARRASISIDNARLYAEAQEAVRSREDLLAIVSHDLRNPLGVVLTSSSLLLKGPLSPEKEDRARRQVEAIQRAGNRMNRLIGDLLDFASIKGGRLSISKRAHDAGELIGDVLETLEPLAVQKAQHLVNDIPGDAGLRLACDRDRMVQVFANVVGNAIKFTPEGGRVSVRAERRGGSMVFAVADNGPGMSAEEVGNVFDRYWQAKRKNREGIGLGLSIVKGIVEAHGGRAWAESELGQGSTFYMALPVGPVG